MDSQAIKYPIYIVSKGRYYNPMTAKMFMKENINFKIAVEPQEYDLYKEKIPEKYILKLPFSNLGLGSYPARNFCWHDSIQNGFDKHYIFDDNISNFSELNNGVRKKMSAKKALIGLQNFVGIFDNVDISGFNYRYFVTSKTTKPFVTNTHVYSGMLINNKTPYRWRLKYNEDVDLCLQVLHNGRCTILLNAYLIDKTSTAAKMKGGNQDNLYQGNDPKKKILKAKVLHEMWPQYVKTVIRFNRPHHYINWKKYFKQPLIKLKDLKK
jgi:hypothetical protein